MKTSDVVKFFDERVKVTCQICGHDHWMVSVDEEGDPPDQDVRCICSNCGFLRIHSLNVVKEWITNHHTPK